MWRKWKPCALLVGLQTVIANMENNLEIPQIINNRTNYDSVIAFLGIYPEKIKRLILKDI